MKSFSIKFMLFALVCHGVAGFTINNKHVVSSPLKTTSLNMLNNKEEYSFPESAELSSPSTSASRSSSSSLTKFTKASLFFSSLASPTIVKAVEEYSNINTDDMEIAELPPVWVPIIFAIFILGGVGLLTSSLGDVYTEEASLGLMSGARAKKEKERSRSSYFKNKGQ